MPDTTQRIDWDNLSPAEIKALLLLHDRGEDGLLDKPHCDNCHCDTLQDLRPDERDAFPSLRKRGYVYFDAFGILGEEDIWSVVGDYEDDIQEFRLDEGIYRERREAAEMRRAELAMTPTFPEFNLEEETAHVG